MQICIWMAFVRFLWMQTCTQKLGNTEQPLRNICPVDINHQKYDQHPHMISIQPEPYVCVLILFFNKFNSFVLEQEFTVPYTSTYKPLCAFVCVIGREEAQQWEQITAFSILKMHLHQIIDGPFAAVCIGSSQFQHVFAQIMWIQSFQIFLRVYFVASLSTFV